MSSDLAADLAFVVDLARGAGRVAGQYYGHVERLTKTNSASTDEAVTEADRATQRFIVQGLRARFPDDGLIGEENDTGDAITFECKSPLGRNWVIDPIDGTNNFIAGLGAFAVCVGLLDGGEPVLGVVYDVTRDAVYAAARGHGAWLDEPRRLGGRHRIRAHAEPLSPSSMVMLTSNLIDKSGRCPAWATHLLGQTTWKTRILGSAAIEAVQVAAGVAHAAVTVNGKLWDAVAPCAVVLEAGGTVTDLQGKPIWPFDLRGYQGAKVPFLASGPAAHQEMLDLMRRHR